MYFVDPCVGVPFYLIINAEYTTSPTETFIVHILEECLTSVQGEPSNLSQRDL